MKHTGLCSTAPEMLPRHAVVFLGGHPGRYTVYLDNLRIRHAEGSTTPIQTSGADTRSKKVAASVAFRNVQVRTVPASSVSAR